MSDVDYVIDALGEKEFSRELSVLKKGGILLSLRTGPNKAFAEKITRIVETEHIVPQVDHRIFDISQINDAMKLVAKGHTNGKVIIRFQNQVRN